MMNNFKFAQKNNAEIFKACSFEVSNSLDVLISKLNELRETIYKCASLNARPLTDSTHEDDCIIIHNLIKKSHCKQKKEIYSSTLEVIEAYREQFIQIDRTIHESLKKLCDHHQRNSLNRKIYENLMFKQSTLNNYFYSIFDSDSPTKIQSDVFQF